MDQAPNLQIRSSESVDRGKGYLCSISNKFGNPNHLGTTNIFNNPKIDENPNLSTNQHR